MSPIIEKGFWVRNLEEGEGAGRFLLDKETLVIYFIHSSLKVSGFKRDFEAKG